MKAFRNDGYAKVTGKAKYADDFRFPGMLHCVPVYSEHVHARIETIDTEKAAAEPGVIAVLTWRDVPGQLYYGQINHDYPILASDKIRYYGDVIALVVAETREKALAASHKINLEAVKLPPVIDAEKAMEEDAFLLFDDRESNIVVHHKVRRGDAHSAIRKCDIVIEQDFETGFFEHAYLEPEGAIAVPRDDGAMEIYGSIQHPVSTRKFICAYLGLKLAEVEVISHPTGGSFGGKDDTASVVAARAALASAVTGRPVKIIYDREWSMRESYKRPAYKLSYRAGFSGDGRLKAVLCRAVADSGPYTSTVPWSTWRATVQCCGPYRVDNVYTDIFGVATNNIVTGAFRGFGSPMINFCVEQLMDMAAERCGLPPDEIRRKNMVYQNCEAATGQRLDNHTVSAEQVMDGVLAKIDFTEKVKRCSWGTPSSPASGDLYGIGFAVSYRGASIGAEGKDFSACIVNCQYDGSILLETGIWENGQGAQTAMILILARELGIAKGRIRYTRSTTSQIPDSGTTVASRGTLLGSGAVYDAARKVKKIIAETIAPVLQCKPNQVRFENDRVWGAAIEDHLRAEIPHSLSWEETMEQMYAARVYPYAFGSFQAPEIQWNDEIGQGNPYFTYVYSAQAVEVVVNHDSGRTTIINIVAAHDIGKAINPPMLCGQIYGGITQGAGMALMERFQIDEGKVRSLNFNTYRIPRSVDVPDIEALIVENSDPASPVGCKGIGEPALEIIAPALANAVYRATGKRHYGLPFQSSRRSEHHE